MPEKTLVKKLNFQKVNFKILFLLGVAGHGQRVQPRGGKHVVDAGLVHPVVGVHHVIGGDLDTFT